MKKRKRPIHRALLEEHTLPIEISKEQHIFEYEIFIEKDMLNNDSIRVVFDTCVFEKCSITNNQFLRSEFIDCRFKNCDMSNNTYTNTTFIRNEFINCKFVGTHFIESFLNDVLIKDSICQYLDVANNKIKILEIVHTDLSHSSWFENSVNGIHFENNKLTGTSLYKTHMKELDISTCSIERLRVDQESIKDMIISPQQATTFCHLLGLHVKE